MTGVGIDGVDIWTGKVKIGFVETSTLFLPWP